MFFKCYSVLLKLGLKKLDAFTLPRPHEGKQIGLITPGTAHIAVFIARTTQHACNAPDGAFDAGLFIDFLYISLLSGHYSMSDQQRKCHKIVL